MPSRVPSPDYKVDSVFDVILDPIECCFDQSQGRVAVCRIGRAVVPCRPLTAVACTFICRVGSVERIWVEIWRVVRPVGFPGIGSLIPVIWRNLPCNCRLPLLASSAGFFNSTAPGCDNNGACSVGCVRPGPQRSVRASKPNIMNAKLLPV